MKLSWIIAGVLLVLAMTASFMYHWAAPTESCIIHGSGWTVICNVN
jgi:hypothetical protein